MMLSDMLARLASAAFTVATSASVVAAAAAAAVRWPGQTITAVVTAFAVGWAAAGWAEWADGRADVEACRAVRDANRWYGLIRRRHPPLQPPRRPSNVELWETRQRADAAADPLDLPYPKDPA